MKDLTEKVEFFSDYYRDLYKAESGDSESLRLFLDDLQKPNISKEHVMQLDQPIRSDEKKEQ